MEEVTEVQRWRVEHNELLIVSGKEGSRWW